MTTSTKQRRLDKIELQLTPREWAVRLADEMRRHSSEAGFLKAIAKGAYRESSYVKPFYALAVQAEERHPGWNPGDIYARNRLDRRLRTEFHALKVLITRVNETIQSRAETNGLKAALKLSTLHALVLQDAFARTARKVAASVDECKTAEADEEEEHQVMLKELGAYADASLAETPSGSLAHGQGLRLRFPSLIEGWVDDSTMLIMDIFAHKAAVQGVQEKYFDGHPILHRNIEGALETTIQRILHVVATFNEYLKTRADLFSRGWDQEERREDGITSAILGEREGHLIIDIEGIQNRANMLADGIAHEWVTAAKDKAVADILQETGEHQDFLWQRLREKAGLKNRR